MTRLALISLLPLGWCGCEKTEPPGLGSRVESIPAPTAAVPVPSVTLPAPPASGEALPLAPTRVKIDLHPVALEWSGPRFVVTTGSAGVYSVPRDDKKAKVGYFQSGGRAPVRKERAGTDGCAEGWLELAGGGFVCGSSGTTEVDSPRAKFAVKAPAIDEILPYRYGRNVKNGTPLYLSVPSREQMLEYEPYLSEKKKDEAPRGAKSSGTTTDKAEKASKDSAADAPRKPVLEADAGAPKAVPTLDGGAPAPWWQREDAKLHEVTLDSLDESDGVIAKRMVQGFYVAIDRTFSWSGRTWYKTTKGLVAPADRLSQTAGADFHGVELGEQWKLPLGWVYGWTKDRPTYEYDETTKKLTPKGNVTHFSSVNLTGKKMSVAKKDYVELADGTWMRAAHLRVTEPGPPPANLAPDDRWIDVNLTTQTVVAYIGATPYYATLISSGKNHADKEKDHSTPTGEFRVQGKHITTTMDGDGSAAGDLPYSIEDVPYVMYFFKSYALHGAFWHRNYGVKMSHGCVNLAPLDAKYLFFFADPPIQEGWHGVWASEQRPGSRVVVHE